MHWRNASTLGVGQHSATAVVDLLAMDGRWNEDSYVSDWVLLLLGDPLFESLPGDAGSIFRQARRSYFEDCRVVENAGKQSSFTNAQIVGIK